VVESGTMRDVFIRPRHPYTQKLLECDPARIPEVTRKLPVIEGSLPNLVALPDGCIFTERCTQSMPRCQEQRPQLTGQGHKAACHLLDAAP